MTEKMYCYRPKEIERCNGTQCPYEHVWVNEQDIDQLNENFKTLKKYEKLLEFVKELAKKSCCNVCECNSCNAVKVLREIGEAK